jgi:hypothetical protein
METALSDLEYDFLNAARELVLRQQELLPLIAEKMGIDPYEYWVEGGHGMKYGRAFGNRGTSMDGKWQWCFHGHECAITNIEDKRSVDVYFGPNGRTDTFIHWSVMLFVYDTKKPWREFPRLKSELGETFTNESTNRAFHLCEALQAKGMIGYADPEGAEWLRKNSSHVVPRKYMLSRMLVITV